MRCKKNEVFNRIRWLCTIVASLMIISCDSGLFREETWYHRPVLQHVAAGHRCIKMISCIRPCINSQDPFL